MIEYPKMLIQEADYCIVADAQAEKEARAKGWYEYGEGPPKPKPPKEARPPKGAGDANGG